MARVDVLMALLGLALCLAGPEHVVGSKDAAGGTGPAVDTVVLQAAQRRIAMSTQVRLTPWHSSLASHTKWPRVHRKPASPPALTLCNSLCRPMAETEQDVVVLSFLCIVGGGLSIGAAVYW